MFELQLKYIANWPYPAYYRGPGNGKSTSFCSCKQFGGRCMDNLKPGEPILRMVYYINKPQNWKRVMNWRLKCGMEILVSVLIPAAAKKEYDEAQAVMNDWFKRNPIPVTNNPGNRYATGRPRLEMLPEERIDRDKILAIYRTYRAKDKKLMEELKVVSAHPELIDRVVKKIQLVQQHLAAIEAKITEHNWWPVKKLPTDSPRFPIHLPAVLIETYEAAREAEEQHREQYPDQPMQTYFGDDNNE